MNPNAKIEPVASSVAPASATAGGDFDHAMSEHRQKAEQAARYRLVIEEGPRAGSFVYKTLDRVTGEVVRQLPREQVMQMLQTGGYKTGSVIDTSA